jgi:hypothetical protein
VKYVDVGPVTYSQVIAPAESYVIFPEFLDVVDRAEAAAAAEPVQKIAVGSPECVSISAGTIVGAQLKNLQNIKHAVLSLGAAQFVRAVLQVRLLFKVWPNNLIFPASSFNRDMDNSRLYYKPPHIRTGQRVFVVDDKLWCFQVPTNEEFERYRCEGPVLRPCPEDGHFQPYFLRALDTGTTTTIWTGFLNVWLRRRFGGVGGLVTFLIANGPPATRVKMKPSSMKFKRRRPKTRARKNPRKMNRNQTRS